MLFDEIENLRERETERERQREREQLNLTSIFRNKETGKVQGHKSAIEAEAFFTTSFEIQLGSEY